MNFGKSNVQPVKTKNFNRGGYSWVDIFKLAMSFLVVNIHTQTITNTTVPTFISCLLNSAVPFFFMVTGFFLGKKITTHDDTIVFSRDVLLSSTRHMLILYIVWYLLYVPSILFFPGAKDDSLFEIIVKIPVAFLVTGKYGYGTILWYILASLTGIIIIFVLSRLKLRLTTIFAISVILYILGIMLKSSGLDTIISNTYLKLYPNNDNGLFKGFPFLMAGVMIWKLRSNICKIWIAITLLVISSALAIKGVPIYPYLFGVGFLILSLSLKSINIPNSIEIRKISTLVYLSHVYIYLFFFHFSAMLGYSMNYLSLSIPTFLVCCILGYLIIRLSNNEKFRLLNYLY